MEEAKKNKLIKKIAKDYSLKLLLLFGSRALKQHYGSSDFDVAYLSERDLILQEESKLIIELSPLFKSENIDLVNLKKAPALLYYAIFNKCEVIYEKEPTIFANLRVYAFKKYVEAKPLYEEKFKKLRQEIKAL